VALAGYWSAGATWLMALVVLLLLVGAFWWMGRYMTRAQQAGQPVVQETEEPLPSF
jgi:hypothetical protein